MNLFVLGATGGIGRIVLEQALARGHGATAFVRSPKKIAVKNERLQILKGDPLDAEELAARLLGHDLVISSWVLPSRQLFCRSQQKRLSSA
jgi:uncharacterized protein